MNRYCIYSRPDGKVEAVKQGWSWSAAFLGGFWAVSKGLWKPAGVVFLLAALGWFLAGVAANQGISPDTVSSAYILVGALVFRFFGANGNIWHERKLRSKGYRMVKEVSDVDAFRAAFNYKASLSDTSAAEV